jgi:broad specificity phosphatase PhoE
MANYLRTERIDAIYTSPMRRAAETAAPLATVFGLEAIVEHDVAEYDRDSPQYIPIEELKASGDPRFHEFASGEGENFDDVEEFRVRTLAALDRIIDRHSGQSVAVVCHGGVINAFLASILGVEFRPPGFFYPNYTSIHRVAAARSGLRTLLTINETFHLRDTGLPVGLFQKD